MHAAKEPNGDRTSELIRDAATEDIDGLFQRLKTSPRGLSEEEAAERLEVFGLNGVAREAKHTWLRRLWTATRNPLVILLTVLAILSFATADIAGGIVMMLMVLLGVMLRFVQETRADNAAAKLPRFMFCRFGRARNGEPSMAVGC